jgi:hypothetical protein
LSPCYQNRIKPLLVAKIIEEFVDRLFTTICQSLIHSMCFAHIYFCYHFTKGCHLFPINMRPLLSRKSWFLCKIQHCWYLLLYILSYLPISLAFLSLFNFFISGSLFFRLLTLCSLFKWCLYFLGLQKRKWLSIFILNLRFKPTFLFSNVSIIISMTTSYPIILKTHISHYLQICLLWALNIFQ